MKKFFRPDSIAVIGASERDRSLGRQIMSNLLEGYTGKIYPVNPGYKEVMGLPCFSDTTFIHDPVDLAIIVVPASATPQAMEACARKGIKRVIIESAGFSEVGEDGKALQDKCTAIAKEAGIRIWGPNCMGIIDITHKYFFTFAQSILYQENNLPGRISLIVQSGLLASGFIADVLSERAIGLGKACSIGNKSDVDECDILEYLLEDAETEAICLYLESISRGRRFLEIARSAQKPIVVVKGGRTSSGAQAALSHTSSLAGNSRLQDSLLEQAGVVLASDFHQMIELARSLAMIPRTPPNCRTAIMTFSGGAGIVTCDLMEEKGLRVADLSADTRRELAGIFPEWLTPSNPVDLYAAFIAGGAQRAYEGAFQVLIKDSQIDVIFIHYFAGLDPIFSDLKAIKEAADKAGKILVLWVIGLHHSIRSFKQEAELCGIPAHSELSRAVECLAAASRYKPGQKTPIRDQIQREIPSLPSVSDELKEKENLKIWDEFDSKSLLKKIGMAVADERIVRSAADAARAVREIGGYPVVLKGLLPGEVHKTETGLVKMGIHSASELKSAFNELKEKMNGAGRILIQKQVLSEYELIAGFMRDEQFGECIMFGLGGILSELQNDVVFAPAPLSIESARRLILRIRAGKLLKGYRGMAPLNEEAMAKILVRLGDLGISYPQIGQIDINPLCVSHGEPIAVDATVILK
jgi:acetyltransferase